MQQQNNNDTKFLSELQKGILIWYPWKKGAKCLLIGNDVVSLKELLDTYFVNTDEISIDESCNLSFIEVHKKEYDYVIAIGILERLSQPVCVLKGWLKLLTDNGMLLLGADNRLGLRYFCGLKDPFTKHCFDGIENYCRYDSKHLFEKGGRCYSAAEIKKILKESGINDFKFYSVFPNLNMPQFIYAEDFLPNEDLSIRYLPVYENPDTVFLKEEYILEDLIENGMFHSMANSYVVECNKNGRFADVKHVTLSLDRGKEKALATIIKNNDIVLKRALYAEGKAQLANLVCNHEDLKRHRVCVIDSWIDKEDYVMPFVEGKVALVYLRNLLLKDKDKFIKAMDHFREIIIESSNHVEDESEDMGVILERGYIDMVPLNCFFINDDFYFFDQEFYFEKFPANAIIYRMIIITYNGNKEMEAILPMNFFLERYGLLNRLMLWFELATGFVKELRNENVWFDFRQRYQRMEKIVKINRSELDETKYYDTLLDKCFLNIMNKKICVFGTGRFAEKFMAMYGKDYEIVTVIDNNSEKWGMDWHGYKIEPPDSLRNIDPNVYKVIVCIKQYKEAVKQLLMMNVTNIGIYDAHYIYPGRQVEIPKSHMNIAEEKKRYHIGYIAGVFDLYHIGHLNMFRRAKEQCDYLIVGVVTDEGVRTGKNRDPFIPFDERIELVRACRYVDEAVEIPYVYCRTPDAFEKYHFDVQFSGSDYENDEGWLAMKKYLEEHGANMVFFPYTQQTSSTKIKALIEEKLV